MGEFGAGVASVNTPAAQEWLAAALPEAVPPFRSSIIAGGYSMVTSRVEDAAGNAWVLRQPPRGQSGGGAHDPHRESRTMGALADSAVPVPRLRIVGVEGDPLGACHVTDFVEGAVIAERSEAEAHLGEAGMRAATTNLVDVLAALHDVEPEAVGLGDLGPAADYNARQLKRWRTLAESLTDHPMAGVAERAAGLLSLGAELARRLPADTAGRIVHGDYRLGNTIVAPDGEIKAVLDWELVTRGEPLADLGMLLVYWDPPAVAMLGRPSPTGAPGALSMAEVVERYAAQSGRDVDSVDLYRGLASWRLACLTLRTAVRFEGGSSADGIRPEQFLSTCDVWQGLTDDCLRAVAGSAPHR